MPTMSTEDALRERVALGLARTDSRLPDEDFERWFGNPTVNDDYQQTASAALKALGIPLSVLAWCAANPEAAKGLAAGEMVAVPKEPTVAMHHAARDWSDKKYGKPIGLDASKGCWAVMLAASTPAPSGKRPTPSPGMDLSIPNDASAPSGEAVKL